MVYDDTQRHHDEKSQQTQKAHNHSPVFDVTPDNIQRNGLLRGVSLTALSPPLKRLVNPSENSHNLQYIHLRGKTQELRPTSFLEYLFGSCIDLYKVLETIITYDRSGFRNALGNTRYYHLMAEKEIDRLNQAGVRIQVDRMGQDRILNKLQECKQRSEEWDYQNVCGDMLKMVYNGSEYPTSRVFIVLPTDLNSWNDSDPSTHQFRLHFLCDNQQGRPLTTDTGMSQHIHFSDHPGYNIKRPQQFFQIYGDYILRILAMIQQGYSTKHYEVPPLNTFQILRGPDANICGGQISEDTIELLVKKAITYLQALSPPNWLDLRMTRSQSTSIKEFLEVPDGHNAEGNLHRFIDEYLLVFWMCEAHKLQYIGLQPLERLREFTDENNGLVDMQKATLMVELRSIAETIQFCTLLTESRDMASITIKLRWKSTRLELETLYRGLRKTRTLELELDGVSVDMHPQSHFQNRTSFIMDKITRPTDLGLVRLLNYPRPGEHYVITGRYGLRLKNSPTRYAYSWVDLGSDLTTFGDKLSKTHFAAEWRVIAHILQSALANHGLSEVTRIHICNKDSWDGVFDLEAGTFVEVHSSDMQLPDGVLTSGCLKSLTQHLTDAEKDQGLYYFLQANTGLQELNISTVGRNVLHQAEHVTRLWCNSSTPLRLTLLECMQDTRGMRSRIVAQVVIGAIDCKGARVEAETQGQADQAETDLLEWRFQLSDDFATFLEMAIQQHTSILTFLKLDISQLSLHGLACIQRVLWQSRLEFLNVVCTTFDLRLSSSLAQILLSVNWSTLKSLVLSGDHIEEWIQLWVTYDQLSGCATQVAPQLLSFTIQGSGSALQLLSHSSVLFIHQLIHSSPLVELYFKNVLLQDKRDWRLIVECIDSLLLETFGLCQGSTAQLVDAREAWELFQVKFEIDE